MIRFACKQCNRPHARAEAEAGSLVFCGCGQGNRVPWESTLPEEPAPAPADAWQARPQPPAVELPRRDPAYCFNHAGALPQAACVNCGEKFCERCLMMFQGWPLCGPCKNLDLRRLQRPRRLAPLAVVAFVLGPLSFPVAFLILSVLAAANVPLPFSLLSTLAPVLAIVLAAAALRQVEGDTRLRGRSLAISGAVAALASACVIVAFSFLLRHGFD